VRRGESGQAAVELAVLAPVLALAVLVFAQLTLAFRAELAGERAAGRAQAAAVLGRSVLSAARDGAPSGTRAFVRAGKLELDVPSGLQLPLPQLARVHLVRPLAANPA
jgi:Flp pilus assembly protein TadG